MFTGIIEELGTIDRVEEAGGGIRLWIAAPNSASELEVNDSMAINGVCLTVVRKEGAVVETEAVEETLKKTTLGSLKASRRVNVELPLRFNDRLGGHLVLGHVDAVGRIERIEERDESWMFTLSAPEGFSRYLVPVGSVAVDGVSLTVAEIRGTTMRISIIPHTMEKTIFSLYRADDTVNLEFDIVGKYIERLMGRGKTDDREKRPLTEEYLRELGYG